MVLQLCLRVCQCARCACLSGGRAAASNGSEERRVVRAEIVELGWRGIEGDDANTGRPGLHLAGSIQRKCVLVDDVVHKRGHIIVAARHSCAGLHYEHHVDHRAAISNICGYIVAHLARKGCHSAMLRWRSSSQMLHRIIINRLWQRLLKTGIAEHVRRRKQKHGNKKAQELSISAASRSPWLMRATRPRPREHEVDHHLPLRANKRQTARLSIICRYSQREAVCNHRPTRTHSWNYLGKTPCLSVPRWCGSLLITQQPTDSTVHTHTHTAKDRVFWVWRVLKLYSGVHLRPRTDTHPRRHPRFHEASEES